MGVDWAHIVLLLMFVGVWALIVQFSVKGNRDSLMAHSSMDSKWKGDSETELKKDP